MPVSKNVPHVNFDRALKLVVACARAKVTPMLIGDPGVGKTSLAAIAASQLGLPLSVVIGSTLDPTDVGGLPVLRGDGLDRIPLEVIRRACEAPHLLLIDELSSAPGAVQAALLRLILDRWAGDRKLHDGTAVVVATNPEEQTPAGSPLSAPLVGRVTVAHLRPDDAEVLAFMRTLGEDGSALRDEALDFAATADVMPDLLEVDLPTGAAQGNEPWGAPRSWERALRARAAVVEGGSFDYEVLHAVTAGAIGATKANAYRAVLRMRRDLPGVEEIAANPADALVPRERDRQVAAVGLLPRVANKDPWASWVYAARLDPEIAVACGRTLMAVKDGPIHAPLAKAGAKARVQIAAFMKGEGF